MDLTPDERHFIRHALGLTYSKTAYRNWYRAGGDDVAIGRSLVEYPPTEVSPDPCFMISSAGFEAVRKKGEKLDREETARILRVDQKARVAVPA